MLSTEERKTFEVFFREHYQWFFQYALHLINDEEVSRDIVCEAFEHIWKNKGDISEDGWFRYTVSNIRNKCIDHIRHQTVHRKYAEFYANIVSHHEERDRLEDDERLAAINHALDALPPQKRHVMEECYMNHRRRDEVAAEMGISTGMVKKHIVTALQMIREHVSSQGFDVIAKKTK